MKTPRFSMLLKRFFIAIVLFLLHTAMTAQTAWYQNQDGHNQPNGTYATSIQPYNNGSFIASYLWTINNDQYTWKISKTTFAGSEQKKFFLTGTTAMVDVKPGNSGSVYVLLRDFPVGQNPVYTVFKLNSNLQMVKQKTITFPGDFNIYNLGVFEMDESDNIYFAGDGQFPNGTGFTPASFLLKTDKNLATKWTRMDTTETSYTSVLVEESGKLLLLEDHYSTFPGVRVSRISANGHLLQRKIVATDNDRMSLLAKLDQQDNLLLYGVRSNNAGEQAIYIRKIARQSLATAYHKTFFTSPGIALNDLQVDRNNHIYSLVTRYDETGEPTSRISRILASNGHVSWSRSIPFNEDSCILSRIVLNRDEKFYLVGERRSQVYFSKGYALRIRKNNGQRDGQYASPDSVSYQRTHVLMAGIIENDNRLIAIGNTNDFDTLTYSSSYFRAFTTRLVAQQQGGGNGCDRPGAEAIVAEEEKPEIISTKASIYPNPASDELNIVNLEPGVNNRLTVFNMQGMPVLQANTTSSTFRMGLRNLSAGAYIVRVQSETGRKDQNLSFIIRR